VCGAYAGDGGESTGVCTSSQLSASSCSSRSARSAPLLPDEGDGAQGLPGTDMWRHGSFSCRSPCTALRAVACLPYRSVFAERSLMSSHALLLGASDGVPACSKRGLLKLSASSTRHPGCLANAEASAQRSHTVLEQACQLGNAKSPRKHIAP